MSQIFRQGDIRPYDAIVYSSMQPDVLFNHLESSRFACFACLDMPSTCPLEASGLSYLAKYTVGNSEGLNLRLYSNPMFRSAIEKAVGKSRAKNIVRLAASGYFVHLNPSTCLFIRSFECVEAWSTEWWPNLEEGFVTP